MRTPFLIALFALSACASTSALSGKVANRDWQAQDVNGIPVVAGSKPLTLRIADGRAAGSSGCNNYSAPVIRSAADRIELGSIVSTRMACEPAVMEQEARFLAILAATRSYTRYGNGSLSLIAPDGRAIRFRPAA
ncbi:MAG TPA: META domain-containing protein [Allosphingosinicella sp.]|jgi:heat shock protein HslJ